MTVYTCPVCKATNWESDVCVKLGCATTLSPIIGFTGKMGVGKSEAIKALKRLSPRSVQLVKFAQPIYDIQEFVYERIEPVYCRDETFVKDRKLLQWIGTDWGRGIRPDLWVSLWRADAGQHQANGRVVTSDDVRFENEAETIRSLGGVVIRITSTEASKRIDTAAGFSGHASEAGLPPKLVDYEIENSGSLEEFNAKLEEIFKKVGVM